MKTCKKCKKQLANKAQLCKYCGADVSNIKPNLTKVKKEIVEKKLENNISLDDTEYLYEKDKKIEEKKEEVSKDNEEIEYLFEKDKKTSEKKEDSLQDKKIKINEKEILKKNLEEFLSTTCILESDTPDILFSKKASAPKEKQNKEVKKENIKKTLKEKLNTPIDIKLKIEELKKKNSKSNKNKSKSIVSKKKYKTKKVKEVKKKQLELVDNSLTKVQQLVIAKKKRRKKKVLHFLLFLLIISCLGYGINKLIKSQIDLGVIIDKEDRNNKNVFNIGDTITYKRISYKVLNVETSQGTSYKKPKEGNEYLVVTINFKNNSQEKYRYSSEDWKMINSKKEETGRIITPINAGKALYSGDLVVGGTKTASIVFEQPIGDKKLELRYYDPEEIKEYNEKIEEQENLKNEETTEEDVEEIDEIVDELPQEIEIKYPKPVFSIKIKL